MTNPLAAHAPRAVCPVSVSGSAKKGRRTKALVKRLSAGDIAVINHADLDGIAAVSLVEAKVAAVLDCSAPITGKYPNRGPLILAEAGIPLFQTSDQSIFDEIEEGVSLQLNDSGQIAQKGRSIDIGAVHWSISKIETAMEAARANLGRQIEEFAANTLQYVREERSDFIYPTEMPPLTGVRSLSKRHVVIVVRGAGYREDLLSILSYIHEVRPILIGVDGGADVLITSGLIPDIILGDMDSVSDKALKCGCKIVVHAYAKSGEAPGMERMKALGAPAEIFPIGGTSEDAAMLLAYEKGAKLIVAVGTHSNMEDFLEKGRSGMASTFLVRLKVGSLLVDARGVSQLYRRSASTGELLGLLLSFAAVVSAVATQSPIVQAWWAVFRNSFLLKFHH
jgi:uncharacterized membrane-anchored protein